MHTIERFDEDSIPQLSEVVGIPVVDLRELYLAAKILRKTTVTFGGGRYVLAID